MKVLLEQLAAVRAKEDELLEKIENHNDGFIYKVGTRRYGAFSGNEYTNSFTAREHMDEYNGDNGIISLETNNKEFAEEMKDHEGLNGHPVIIIN